ncbi:hypothetical protein M378DRAFT_107446 [Amanita muscaria Koide BX008]|uniref:Phosphoglycerate mutase-like protein n=1 Tax=Amanita muscaria (strain Koide BX008) TaxID=946122 RepID=A0A0C2X3D9_AMAMK|nr:hypothetical protein M378DRAFT_107446 [Amanita muscaria Koide BX008]
MVRVYFTFIRHGESTDNLHSIWAGWRDAPLSKHGMSQATALAKAHANTPYTVVFSSPLMRALGTAEALQQAQNHRKPSVTTSLLLREQHFGVAEGQPYRTVREPGLTLDEHFAQGIFPAVQERHLKFPNGESRNDMAERANQAIDELLIPYIKDLKDRIDMHEDEYHVAIVSHGLFIREITNALLRRDAKNAGRGTSKGISHLRNTGWARLVAEITVWRRDMDLRVHIVDHHRTEHLSGLVRQKAGIGSMAHDPKQKDIRAFFGSAKARHYQDISEGTKFV